MEIRLLGPVEALVGGRLVPVPRRHERLVLAVLALERGRSVPGDRLIDLIWSDQPPSGARGALQTYISRLRATLAGESTASAAALQRRGDGYVLRLSAESLDAERFRRTVEEARRTTDMSARVDLLRAALGLWRGPAVADVGPEPVRLRVARELDESRLSAIVLRAEAELALGRHDEVIEELTELAAEFPHAERLTELRMLALVQSGRRADALDAFRRLRENLIADVGLEPSTTLQHLQRRILHGDIDAASPPVPLAVRVQPDPNAPAQLPAAVTGFTGRSVHLAWLDRLLDDAEGGGPSGVVISAIGGMAGVGKTALAVRWGHRVIARFPDGQLYEDLRGYAHAEPARPIDVLGRFLRALGVAAKRVPVDVVEAAAMYRSVLAQRRMLIVLDNAASADQVRPLLPGRPQCCVVVTSRNLLGGLVVSHGVRRLTLDVLTDVEAIELLSTILGAVRVRAEPTATNELAHRCAYLPLALRIAAANLAAQPERSIADYVDALGRDHRLDELAAPGDPAWAARASFDLSYRRLDSTTQRVFRLLGHVPGPDFGPEAVAALTNLSTSDAELELERLADAHLVAGRGHRYGMHDLLREFAAEQGSDDPTSLSPSESPVLEPERALQRLFSYYLQSAAAACRLVFPHMAVLPNPSAAPGAVPERFDGREQALSWFETELPNIMSAVRRAASARPRPYAWLLADAIRGFLWLGGRNSEWWEAAETALAVAEAEGDLPGQAAAHLSLGSANHVHDREAMAIAHDTAALRLCRQAGWEEGEASALSNLGLVHWSLGELEVAERHVREALTVERRAGRRSREAAVLSRLGTILHDRGRLPESADRFAATLAIEREEGSLVGQVTGLVNLGVAETALGRLKDAIGHLDEGLAMAREIGLKGGESTILESLASAHCDAGHYASAAEYARAALVVARDVGYRRNEAEALNTLGKIALQTGAADAAEQFRRALEVAEEIGELTPVAVALDGLAAATAEHSTDEARGYAERALKLARDAGYRIGEAKTLSTLAIIALNEGIPTDAVRDAETAVSLNTEIGHRLAQARSLVTLAQAQRQVGRAEDAFTSWRLAMDILNDVGGPETDTARAMMDD